MLQKIVSLGLILFFYSSDVLSYQIYDFNHNYQGLLNKRSDEYNRYDRELNELYSKSLSFFDSKNKKNEFRDVQRKWLKYKIKACDAKPYFEGEEPSNDVMTQYLIAECNSWVTQARILEIKYSLSKDVELSYAISRAKIVDDGIKKSKEWDDYKDYNCKFISEESECNKRMDFYYKELEL
ncbi:Protein of unknown function [Vibrio xiamenensis]|uniref:Lysozyme inhibitor LprI-like N-terminal domain-containing protein n=1 Tax=Vibrio xiamenensis TaxID=861298 RepID=A0A1G8DUC1_9VIBR|nr:lysozyme inhibitor LprI family protein [Vibrio xiamenensis]SDH61205.1 Protein of unknown function [Vibrio xiamenensis]